MTADHSPSSPASAASRGLPRSELERALENLVEQADRVLGTQDRLRHLLAATRAVGEGLDLPVVLRRIAQAAVDLVGAQYGALGVIGPDGSLEQFIHVGLDDETASRIGDLPRGRGILGTVIAQAAPVRVEHMGSDSRSYGFPADHPPMDSFLGVPIRVRDEVFGNLYLTNRRGGPFTREDEELLEALAASAGVAIENARLFGEAERRQRWAIASAETTSALLAQDEGDPLSLIGQTVARLTDAAVVATIAPTPSGGVRVDDAWGPLAEALIGTVYPPDSTLSETVIGSGNPRVTSGVPLSEDDASEGLAGPTMVVPFLRPDATRGAFAIVRPATGERFLDADLDMALEFAGHASVALELREARHAHERLTLLEDRNRIARDLHDNVIQRLFGAGLSLNGLDIDRIPPDLRGRLDSVIVLLDEAIAEIRKSVFALRATSTRAIPARHRLLDVVSEAASSFPSPPRLLFDGDLDSLVLDALLHDLEAVLREGLSNAARHAQARSVTVTLTATPEQVTLLVVDDGHGPTGSPRSSGLANLAERADAWNGEAELRAGDERGAVLEWRVPTPTV